MIYLPLIHTIFCIVVNGQIFFNTLPAYSSCQIRLYIQKNALAYLQVRLLMYDYLPSARLIASWKSF